MVGRGFRMDWRRFFIEAGFGVLGASGLHAAAAPLTRGRGAILTFHHVLPDRSDEFAPNRLLTVTPDYLDKVIRRLRDVGYDIVSMDEAIVRLAAAVPRRRFAVLTFDDGLRDHLDHALPVLERHGVPGTFYVTTGFADRTARLWWIEIEEAVRRADHLSVMVAGERIERDTRDPAAKRLAFDDIYWRLREGPEETLRAVVDELCRQHAVDPATLVDRYCLDWSGIETLARHPLVTVGAHTLSHPMLAKYAEDFARREIREGRAVLERRLGRTVHHLAYPVGDPASAGAREFRLACEAGYASAVTTRPGLLFPAHDKHPHALPRVSMNGYYQSRRALDVLLSGMALLLWNKGRRIMAA